MSLYERVANLPLTISGYRLEGLELPTGFFTRKTTVVHLEGKGEVGVGEDATYEGDEHDKLQALGPVFPLTGETTVHGFSRLLDAIDLFPKGQPPQAAYRLYRRWAFESAALDLALRQAGTTLAEALGRELRPLTFVYSTGLGDPPALTPLTSKRERDPGLRFKLDPVPAWDDAIVEGLQALGGVEVVDFKGHYHGTVVDNPPDPALYRRIIEAFPEAYIEDPAVTAETRPILEPHVDRVTWDAPVHALSDVAGAPFGPPKAVNIKPSRFGFLSELLRTYEYCEARGIAMYGGGQFELGPGRGQIQVLASLFHADAANDTAPAVYNDPNATDLPPSPLTLPAAPGFRGP